MSSFLVDNLAFLVVAFVVGYSVYRSMRSGWRRTQEQGRALRAVYTRLAEGDRVDPGLVVTTNASKLERFEKSFEAPLAQAYRANGFSRIDDNHPALRRQKDGFYSSDDGRVLGYRRRAWKVPALVIGFVLAWYALFFAAGNHLSLVPILVPVLFIAMALLMYQDLTLVLHAGRHEAQWVRSKLLGASEARTLSLRDWEAVEVKQTRMERAGKPLTRTELRFKRESLALDNGWVAGSNWQAEARTLEAWRQKYQAGVEAARTSEGSEAA